MENSQVENKESSQQNAKEEVEQKEIDPISLHKNMVIKIIIVLIIFLFLIINNLIKAIINFRENDIDAAFFLIISIIGYVMMAVGIISIMISRTNAKLKKSIEEVIESGESDKFGKLT